jgi:drug/metabolite transporter (DMT)-like permease
VGFFTFLIEELAFWASIEVTLLVGGIILLFVPGGQVLGVICIVAAVAIFAARKLFGRLFGRDEGQKQHALKQEHRLRTLDVLRKRGEITDAEYEEQRRRVISET